MAPEMAERGENAIENEDITGSYHGHDEGRGWSQNIGRGGGVELGGQSGWRYLIGSRKCPASSGGGGNPLNKMISPGLTAATQMLMEALGQ